jgi:hypothetical protein
MLRFEIKENLPDALKGHSHEKVVEIISLHRRFGPN